MACLGASNDPQNPGDVASVWRSNGATLRPWQSVQGEVRGELLAVSDFNGDGAPDALTAGPAPSVWLWLNSGGQLQPVREPLTLDLPADQHVRAFRVADLTADGKADLVVVSSDSYYVSSSVVSVHPGTGSAFSTSAPIGPAAPELGIADMNGDGVHDLVYATGHDSFANAWLQRPPLVVDAGDAFQTTAGQYCVAAVPLSGQVVEGTPAARWSFQRGMPA